MIHFTGASPEQEEAHIKFSTYLGYLRFYTSHLLDEYGANWENLAERCIAASAGTTLCKEIDRPWIERFLKISWNTEFLLSNGPREPELIRVNNQWVPIQAYYAVYSAAEALCQLIDGHRADGHTKALRKVTDFLTKFKLTPWDKAYVGPRGKDRHSHKPINFPAGLKPAESNLKRAGVKPLEMVAKCLMAEHSNRIDDYKRKQKSGMPYQHEYDPGLTGLLHFLYRLRLKSNYMDIDLFVQETITLVDTQAFYDCMRQITASTLILFEVLILRKVGLPVFAEMVNDYLKLNPSAKDLGARLAFYGTEVGA